MLALTNNNGHVYLVITATVSTTHSLGGKETDECDVISGEWRHLLRGVEQFRRAPWSLIQRCWTQRSHMSIHTTWALTSISFRLLRETKPRFALGLWQKHVNAHSKRRIYSWIYFIFFLLFSGGQLDGCYALSGNLPRMWTFVPFDVFVSIWVANKVLSLSG